MAPSTNTAARRVASPGVAADPARHPSRRPPLHVVPSRRRAGVRSRIVRYLPAIMVVLALLVVVAGQAILADGQVRMTGLDQQLQAAQARHSAQEERVSNLETPSRIVRDATANGKMTRPSHVTQLPYVALNIPLATPNVTPAPGSAVNTTTTPAVSQ
jgi:Tfp pilus assembly protein PilX